jgi:D-alanyl-D-alanine carboxypeptidase (penicillin-binding protein 5/6)
LLSSYTASTGGHAKRVLRRFPLNTLTAAAGALVALAAVFGTANPAALAADSPAQVVGGPELGGQGVIVNYPQADRVQRLPDIAASAWVIADAGTGQVLAAKDPHGEYRPASTLKVLTAVSLIPVLDPGSSVVATQLAASQTPNDIGLLPGHSYQVSDLFTALLTISANDAAVALTQATGSLARGMTIINDEAHHLQADDTDAVDPNGLDAPGQHTSAYDLALIGRAALQLPSFMKYDETQSGLFPITARKKVGLWNQNGLLVGYPGGIGGKIGWTSAAGATYVGLARRNGVTLIVTLLHCPALTEIASAEKLLNWGFAEDGKVAPVGTLVSPLPTAAQQAAKQQAAEAAAARTAEAAAQQAAAALADRHSSPLGSPSVLAAAGFTAVAVMAVGLGFAYSTRSRRRGQQRPSAPDAPSQQRTLR